MGKGDGAVVVAEDKAGSMTDIVWSELKQSVCVGRATENTAERQVTCLEYKRSCV